MFATVLCSWTLLPTTFHVTPFGLRKTTCGSVTTRAVRLRSSFMSEDGSAPLAGGAYLPLAASALPATAPAAARAATAAAPVFRNLRRSRP
jgi:hypothetical protein